MSFWILNLQVYRTKTGTKLQWDLGPGSAKGVPAPPPSRRPWQVHSTAPVPCDTHCAIL